MEESKKVGIFWLGGAGIFVALIILSIPFIGKRIPWSVENKIAKSLSVGKQLGVCTSVDGNVALKKLVARLQVYPTDNEFPLNVQVVSGETINAFASLGGEVFVYQGLLKKAESPEELAGVLAHEMEHVHHRHIMQGAFGSLITYGLVGILLDPGSAIDPRAMTALLNLKFTKSQEDQADREGLKRLNAAHVDVTGFANFFKRQSGAGAVAEMLSDHPSSEDRSTMAQSFYQKDFTPVLTAEEWTKLKADLRELA